MPTTYEPIATTTLGSAAATITISSIPSTYTDLRVVVAGTSNPFGSVLMRLNNNGNSVYSQTDLTGNGSSVSSTRTTPAVTEFSINKATNFSLVPQVKFIDIFSYSGSTFKTLLLHEPGDINSTGSISFSALLFASTAAVNRIDVFSGNGTFSTGTILTVYGIKNA
jgi:hypothetical protein